jgi:hypothetical protein
MVEGSGTALVVTSTFELSGAKSEIAGSPVTPPKRGQRLTVYCEGTKPLEGNALSGTVPLIVAPEKLILLIAVLVLVIKSRTVLPPAGLRITTESKRTPGAIAGNPWGPVPLLTPHT